MKHNKLTLDFNLIDDYVNIEAKCQEREKDKEKNKEIYESYDKNDKNCESGMAYGDSIFLLSKSLTSYNNKVRNSRILNSLESFVPKGIKS